MQEIPNLFVEPGPDDPVVPRLMMPHSEAEVTKRYELVDVTRHSKVPLMRVVHPPRHPVQTDAQYRHSRRENEDYYRRLSVMRHVAHMAAETLGFPARCARPACRRAKRCVSDRHEFDWSFPGPWMPPCATTLRLIEQVRTRMLQMAKQARLREAGRLASEREVNGTG